MSSAQPAAWIRSTKWTKQFRDGKHQARNRGAGFWRAVHAVDCAPHPRATSLLGGLAVHGEARRNPRAGAGGHRALSGGPSSVYDKDAPLCDPKVLQLGVPVLGICYGMQWLTHTLGGKVARADRREYGPAQLDIEKASALFKGCANQLKIWNSHGDHVIDLPAGFHVTGPHRQRRGRGRKRRRRAFMAWSFIRK